MGEIIDDLLTLSRVTRWEMTRENLDLSNLAESIFFRLQNDEPGRNVTIDVQPGIVASADRRLVTIALENLLENAWKFTSKRDDARISFAVSLMPTPSSAFPVKVYTVADNGAGFEQKYASELFDSFRRLHSPDQFTGTGIGLATVQRAIARHNGEVWGEGTPGYGATFYFTLG
jgi:light-regulated signal transduction histidine kinase (bacteriophytochrome)